MASFAVQKTEQASRLLIPISTSRGKEAWKSTTNSLSILRPTNKRTSFSNSNSWCCLYNPHPFPSSPCSPFSSISPAISFRSRNTGSSRMGQTMGGLWDRVQGKGHVRRSCDKVFELVAEKENGLLLSNLHVATLLVYNSMNKQFLSPHKEPPSRDTIQKKIKSFKTASINNDQFYETVLQWIQKDLQFGLANKVILTLLAAPAMAIITKSAGRNVPRIQHVVDKVPTPVIISAYAAGLVLLQDVKMD